MHLHHRAVLQFGDKGDGVALQGERNIVAEIGAGQKSAGVGGVSPEPPPARSGGPRGKSQGRSGRNRRGGRIGPKPVHSRRRRPGCLRRRHCSNVPAPTRMRFGGGWLLIQRASAPRFKNAPARMRLAPRQACKARVPLVVVMMMAAAGDALRREFARRIAEIKIALPPIGRRGCARRRVRRQEGPFAAGRVAGQAPRKSP